MNERDKQILKKFILGGASIGAGTALITSLLNYMGRLKDRTKEDSGQDDETLYINIPTQKEASVLNTGAAMAAGALASMGSYALIRRLYTEMLKRELQKEVDEAQQIHLQALQEEAERESKKAASTKQPEGKPLGVLETVTSIPVASALLLALASGVLTNHMLDKTFPAIEKPKFKRPRRIVLREVQVNKKDNEKADALAVTETNPYANTPIKEQQKVATFVGDELDGLDYVANIVMSQPGFDRKSELPDLVGAVASGRANEFFKVAHELGHDAAFSVIKGASDVLNDNNRVMAIAATLRSPLVGPIAQTMVAAEAFDMFPNHCKMARYFDETTEKALFALACWAGACVKSSAVKSVGAVEKIDPALLEEIKKIIETSDLPDRFEQEDSNNKKPKNEEGSEDSEEPDYDDVIDIVMSGQN
jgi:hypothetical protein